MPSVKPPSSLTPRDLARAWWRVLSGNVPLLSIEITRELLEGRMYPLTLAGLDEAIDALT